MGTIGGEGQVVLDITSPYHLASNMFRVLVVD
jgi:hypothetical protein